MRKLVKPQTDLFCDYNGVVHNFYDSRSKRVKFMNEILGNHKIILNENSKDLINELKNYRS